MMKILTAAGEDVDLCCVFVVNTKLAILTAKLWHDYGYKIPYQSFNKFVKLFKKYKSSSNSLRRTHSSDVDSSESILCKGNMTWSLIYRLRKSKQPHFIQGVYDYIGEMKPFVKRVRKPHLLYQ